MVNKITVSIIVPCFNQGLYLPEALQSVLNQVFSNWECLIINDGSTDDTEDIAKKWVEKDSRFNYIFTKNKGVSNARNIGIHSCKGIYVQFLDADDILETEKIAYQADFLNQNKIVDIVYGSSRYFFSGNKKLLYPIHFNGLVPTTEMNFTDNTQKEVLTLRNVCTNCSSLYRKEIFMKFLFKDIIYEDWFFHIECALNNFVFHYTNKENCTSLIRMSNKSQLIRHNEENRKSDYFKQILKNLVTEKNFTSNLEKYLQNNRSEIISKNNIFRLFLVNILPPVIFKIIKALKGKL